MALALACAMAVSGTVRAQGYTGKLDDASELRRLQEREHQRRERVEQTPNVRLPSATSSAVRPLPLDEKPCFVVKRFTLRGAGPEPMEWVLKKLAGPNGRDEPVGRCLGAQGVATVVERAQAALIERGLVTSRVLIEAQDMSQGSVTLTVIPGRIRKIRQAEPTSPRATLWNAFPARPGDLVNLRDVEQALENLQRVPTAQADIQIEPTDAPGESDLVVRWQQDMPWRGSVSLDDSGSPGTGRYQGAATFSQDHLWTLNDLFYLGVQNDLGGSDPGSRGTHGWSAHYSVPLGYDLFTIGLNRNRYFQTVAGAAQDYVYSGRSHSQDVRWSRLVHRDATGKTTLHAKLFVRQSTNHIDDTEILVQRRRVGGWEVGVGHRAFVGQGTVDLNLAYQRGTGAFGARPAPEELFGEGTSRFGLLRADAQLQQPLQFADRNWQYSGHLRAQLNTTALTPQDRFSIGGRYSVRGFDGDSSLSAERGWLVRQEVATSVGLPSLSLYAGLDHGCVGGASARFLVGSCLTGTVLGMRGGFSGVYVDVFAGAPLDKPQGFRTADTALGFQLQASF
jgi:hemolysin activation/secretion protein